MAAPKGKQPYYGDAEPYEPLPEPLDSVSVYRLTPVVTARPHDVMAAVQEWWDSGPTGMGPVDEHLTWKLDGCVWDLTIKSSESE